MQRTSEVRSERVSRGKRARSEWMRVSKGSPCKICDSSDWCTYQADVACCMRVKSDRPMKNGGFMHKLTDSLGTPERIIRPKEKRPTDLELHARFAPLCRSWYVGRDEATRRLAETLGVATWALDALHVGWDGEAWTFPEVNPHGHIIGVNRRFPDGKKLCLLGSRRGLTFAEDWADAPGPIFVVEGGSDVAAGLTLGLCVVGRPSNMGGVEYLVRLLGKHDRRVVLLAERDKKDRSKLLPTLHDPSCQCCGQCFPGKFGAIETAKRLSVRLSKLVHWSFLPSEKDMRAWLNSSGANPNNEQAMMWIAAGLIQRTRNVIH